VTQYCHATWRASLSSFKWKGPITRPQWDWKFNFTWGLWNNFLSKSVQLLSQRPFYLCSMSVRGLCWSYLLQWLKQSRKIITLTWCIKLNWNFCVFHSDHSTSAVWNIKKLKTDCKLIFQKSTADISPWLQRFLACITLNLLGGYPNPETDCCRCGSPSANNASLPSLLHSSCTYAALKWSLLWWTPTALGASLPSLLYSSCTYAAMKWSLLWWRLPWLVFPEIL
jgi:hypothetical protein